VVGANPPFVTGGSHKIDRLPDHLAIDAKAIPPEKREPLSLLATESSVASLPRPSNYLVNVDERGDETLQAGNAPWGVPSADLILNRLGYVLGYDLRRHMPRWVAYSIGPRAQSVPRTQNFVADPAIAADRQAQISDYRASGYDRGHMISPADLFFKGPVVVEEAYYMSTVAPQTAWLNRRLWNGLEVRVRDAVESQNQPAFVIAGPLFIAPAGDATFKFETIGEGRILVPTHFFRVVAMRKADGGVDVFGVIAPNARHGAVEIDRYLVPIREIEQKSGLRLLPLLPPQIAEKIKSEVGRIW
jgi:endonuclease G